MLQNGLADTAGTPAKRPRTVYKFGSFELRSESGELFKRGIRIRLQMKPLQVLQALLEKPGEPVTREELCKRLWPAGTFVDFENGLNTATNRLRVALRDSADSPLYIETLPRLGYRLVCPVLRVEHDNLPRVPVDQALIPENPVERQDDANRLSTSLRTAVIAILVMVALVLGTEYIRARLKVARSPHGVAGNAHAVVIPIRAS